MKTITEFLINKPISNVSSEIEVHIGKSWIDNKVTAFAVVTSIEELDKLYKLINYKQDNFYNTCVITLNKYYNNAHSTPGMLLLKPNTHNNNKNELIMMSSDISKKHYEAYKVTEKVNILPDEFNKKYWNKNNWR